VGLGCQAELSRRRAEGLDIATGDLAIECEVLTAAALQVESQFHVSPGQFLLEQPAQLHLQRIAVRRHAEVHIEKAVVHRLQRQSEAQGTLARHTDLRIRHLPFYLRKPGHGTNRHDFRSAGILPAVPRASRPRRFVLPYRINRRVSRLVPQPFFRPFGARLRFTIYPRLAPWALFLRRFAAFCVPATARVQGCETWLVSPPQVCLTEPHSPWAAPPRRTEDHTTAGRSQVSA